MKLLKSRKFKRIWKKSAKRLTFGGLKKIAVVVLLVGLNWAGIAAIGQTAGYFTDEENSSGNVLAAGSLDIVLTASPSAGFLTEEKANYLLPGDFVIKEIEVSNAGSLVPEYDVTAAFAYSDPFCDALSVKAELNSVLEYEGWLKDFSLVSVASISGSPDEWRFSVGLPDGSGQFKGNTCEFSFIFKAHQDELPFGQGFYDEEKVDGVLTGGGEVVMNEFLPNPEGLDTQLGILGEWVEFYNNSSRPIDLTGWYIKDKAGHKKVISSANTLNGQTIIGPKGSGLEWLVLFMNDDILNNTSSGGGELVSFYNNSDKLMDQYGYFQSVNDSDSQSDNTPGSENEFTGSEVSAQEGKSYARIPDGTGYWVDPVPTPGGPNVLGGDETVPEEVAIENVASPSFSETLGLVAGAVTGFISGSQETITASGSFEIVASPSEGQDEIANSAPVASESVEPLAEPPLDSPDGDLTGQALPEPADDGSSIQVIEEPAIPAEPVTVEQPTEPVPPSADPPLPTSPSENLGGQVAPAPEAPPAPADSASSPQAE